MDVSRVFGKFVTARLQRLVGRSSPKGGTRSTRRVRPSIESLEARLVPTAHQIEVLQSDPDANIYGQLFVDRNGNGIWDWNDFNNNTVQDSGEAEPLFYGYWVDITDTDDVTVTNQPSYIIEGYTDGSFSYSYLPLDTELRAHVQLPTGWHFGLMNQGSDDTVDSDFYTNGNSEDVEFTAVSSPSGPEYYHINAGVYQTATITDTVWYDANRNGIHETSEVGLENVQVQLQTATGALVQEVTSGLCGVYTFSNVVPGEYRIHFAAPRLTFTTQGAGSNPVIDSDADAEGNTPTFHVYSGATVIGVAAGVYPSSQVTVPVRRAPDGNPLPCQSVPVSLLLEAPTASGNVPIGNSSNPVRYSDGVVQIGATDLVGTAPGFSWNVGRAWTNGGSYTELSEIGYGWSTPSDPYLIWQETGIIVKMGGSRALFFDLVEGEYQAAFNGTCQLVHDETNEVFRLTDSYGTTMTFADFSGDVPMFLAGRLQSVRDAGGNTLTVTIDDADGTLTEVQREYEEGGVSYVESFLYAYSEAGYSTEVVGNDTTVLLDSVTQRRRVDGGAWTTLRKAEYAYYDGMEDYGNAFDLKTVTLRDGANNLLDRSYYRYYVAEEANGYEHGLKVFVSAASFARASADLGNVFTATDTQLAPYADNYFEYDEQQRVTKEIAQGAGCSACAGGMGTFTFDYTTSSNTPSPNTWKTKTVETLPDGNQNIVFTNNDGQVILHVYHLTGTSQDWITFYQYDEHNRVILQANPSAVSGYDEEYFYTIGGGTITGDLMGWDGDDFEYLRDDAGEVLVYTYGTSTTASTSTAGDVFGHQKTVSLRHGEMGTDVLQNTSTYIAATAGDSTIYLPATSTVYRNDNGTGAQTTSASYTFFSGTTQVQSQTVTMPVVSTTQNGTGTASTVTTVFDALGRPTWTKDADGFLTYTQYAADSDGVVKTIVDVDTSETADFVDLPSGWSTPSGGGLHLVTEYTTDVFGRATSVTDARGVVSYVVYNDVAREVRTYLGWDTTTDTPTGPTQVWRDDRARGYQETLTMSATPTLDGSDRPDGSEAISGVQSLTRSVMNTAAQVVATDVYTDLAGVGYGTSVTLGSAGENYLRTVTGYGQRGQLNRVVTPDGVIHRYVYDGLGRLQGEWIGTDDTPSSGFWSPANPAEMLLVREYVYDGGLVGDGDLTTMIEHPGLGQADIQTDFFYDWRGRLVASKTGVESSEDTEVNRPLVYFEYDNLNQQVAQEVYDGDAVDLVDGNEDGVPDKPAAELLRSRQVLHFDDEGRLYRSEQVGVDPEDGDFVDGSLITNLGYDRRGHVTSVTNPLDQAVSYVHDGAGRLVSMTDALSHTQTLGYNALGQVTSVTDALDHATTYTYDLAARLTAITDALDHTTSYDYNAAGQVESVTDANDHATTYTFDLAGRMLTRTDALSGVTTWGYNSLGQLASITNAEDETTTLGYDELGRQARVTDALTHTSVATFDLLGRMLDSHDALDHETTYSFDVAGRLASVTDPEDRTSTFGHDALGRLVSMTDALDHTTTTQFDPFGRVAAVVDALTGTTSFGYDAATRRTSLMDPVGNLTSFEYDAASRLIAQTDPLEKTTEYGYDDANRLTFVTDRLGRKREFTYDEANRLTQEEWIASDGLTVVDTLTFGYDEANNLTSASNAAGAYALTYDELNRVTHVVEPTDVTLDFGYDAVSRRTSVEDSLGGYEVSIYDDASRLTSRRLTQEISGSSDQEMRIDFGYDAANRVTSQTRYSDLAATTLVAQTTRGYNDANQITSIHTEDALDNVLADFVYTFDVKGRLETKTDNGVLTTYSYDDTDQLTGEDVDGGSNTTYSFDANGNRTMTGYVTGDGNRYETDGTWDYTFDDEGNLVQKVGIVPSVNEGETWNYTYDHRNQLTKVERLTNGTDVDLRVEYTIDAFNTRIARTADLDGDGTTESPVTTQYVLDAWNSMKAPGTGNENTDVLADIDDSGNLITRYLRGDQVDELLGRVDVAATTPAQYWVLTDHLGSVRAVVADAGSVVDAITFDAWGNITTETNSALRGRYAWTGRELDPDTGLQHNRAREYDVTQGRWLSGDPLVFSAGDPNLYRYVGNSVHATDPSGLLWGSLTAGGGAVIGGIGGAIVGSGGYTMLSLYQGNFQWRGLAGATAGGAVGGAVGGAIAGALVVGDVPTAGLIVGGVAVGAIAGGTGAMAGDVTEQLITDGRVDWGRTRQRGRAGMIVGGVTGGVGAIVTVIFPRGGGVLPQLVPVGGPVPCQAAAAEGAMARPIALGGQILAATLPPGGGGAGNLRRLTEFQLEEAGLDAEAFKEFVGVDEPGRFNIHVGQGGELHLVPVRRGSGPNIPTGWKLDEAAAAFPL